MINVIEDMRNEFKIKLTEKTRPGWYFKTSYEHI